MTTNRDIQFIVRMRDEAKAKLREMGTNLRGLATNASFAARGAQRSMAQIGDAAGRAQRRVGALGLALRGAVVAALATAAAFAVRAFVDAGDAYTNMTNRLTSIGVAAEDTRGKLRELNAIARGSSSDLESTVTLYSRASVALGELGAGADETSRFVTTWQRAMSVGGASVQEAASATLQFSQALGSGVLRGEEFNAINEASPYIMRRLAESMGVPVGALRQLAQEGKITGEVLREALADMTSRVDQDFSRMGRTVAQAWQGLKDQVGLSVGEINSSLSASDGLAGFIDQATDAVKVLGEIIGELLIPAFQVMGEVLETFTHITGIAFLAEQVFGLNQKTAQAGESADAMGESWVVAVRRALVATRGWLNWFQAAWAEFWRYVGVELTNWANSFNRTFAGIALRVQALSASMVAFTQGKFGEAEDLAGRAFGDGITAALREQFPHIQNTLRELRPEDFVLEALRQDQNEGDRRRPVTATGQPVQPGAGPGASGTDEEVESTTTKVVEQTRAVRENITIWDAMRESAKAAAEGIKSQAELMREAWSTAFERAGQALQEFARTGELNVRSLVAAVLQEISAMMAAEAWKQFMSAMSSMGGSGSSSSTKGGGSGSSNSNFWADAAMFVAGFFHDGGIVGESVKTARSINPAVFAKAKRYHSGGLVGGEVPIIAKRGEAVMPTVRLPNGQLGVQAMGGGGGGATVIQYNTFNISGADKDGEAISEEVAVAAAEKMQKSMRGVAQDEIRKANSFGGQSNWQP